MKTITKSEKFDLKNIFGIKIFEKWIKNYPILKNEDVLKWIIDKIQKYSNEGKSANKFNVASYLNPLQKYCLYNKTENPSEFLKENIDARNLRVRDYLNDFLLNMEIDESKIKELGFRKRPSEVSVRNSIQSRIKSFYSNRGASVSFNLKSKKTGACLRELTLTKPIIKKIQSKLESSNYRLICKCQSQLGLRISDILNELTSGKYIIEKHEDHYYIRNFETQKRKVTINNLFFTKELEICFIANTGIDDLCQVELSELFLTRTKRRINGNDYLQRLKEIIKELGIIGNIKTHSFRKYYMGQIGKCTSSFEDPRILTHFEGHEAGFADQAYLRVTKDIDTYYSEWKKTEICVCIDCILVDKTNKEILKLKEKNLNLEKQVKLALKEKMDFEERIKEEIENVKESLSKVKKSNKESIIMEFSENLMNALNNRDKSKTILEEYNSNLESNRKTDITMDIYSNVLIEKLLDVATKEILSRIKKKQ